MITALHCIRNTIMMFAKTCSHVYDVLEWIKYFKNPLRYKAIDIFYSLWEESMYFLTDDFFIFNFFLYLFGC